MYPLRNQKNINQVSLKGHKKGTRKRNKKETKKNICFFNRGFLEIKKNLKNTILFTIIVCILSSKKKKSPLKGRDTSFWFFEGYTVYIKGYCI